MQHSQYLQGTYKEMKTALSQTVYLKRVHAQCQALYQVLKNDVADTSQSSGGDTINRCNNTFTLRFQSIQCFGTIRTRHQTHHRRDLDLVSLQKETNTIPSKRSFTQLLRGAGASHPPEAFQGGEVKVVSLQIQPLSKIIALQRGIP